MQLLSRPTKVSFVDYVDRCKVADHNTDRPRRGVCVGASMSRLGHRSDRLVGDIESMPDATQRWAQLLSLGEIEMVRGGGEAEE
jgi:hypothetical protein